MKVFKFDQFLTERWGNQKHYIQDLDLYNQSMMTTIDDKIFFLNYVTPDVIVDFGCADGATLQKISKVNSDIKLVGFDLSDVMLNKAKSNVPDGTFTKKWNEIETLLQQYEKPLILLSSVIHEVYSYTPGNQIADFWKKVFKSNFKYIAIRDMMPSSNLEKMKVTDDEYQKIINGISNPKIISDFEGHWGKINLNRRNLIHFLLKYRYFDDNWNRELLENYVPITKETLEKRIPNNWSKVYSETFTLPFLKKSVMKDFGIDLKDNTHLKLLLERD